MNESINRKYLSGFVIANQGRVLVLKKFMSGKKLFPKLFINFVIGRDLMELEYSAIKEVLEKLKEEISYYHSYFSENPDSKLIHMVLAELNRDDWNVFHRKHFIHHLSQLDCFNYFSPFSSSSGSTFAISAMESSSFSLITLTPWVFLPITRRSFTLCLITIP